MVWKDRTGERHGRLLVIKITQETYRNEPKWECLCDCGATTFVVGSQLGVRITGCGCGKYNQGERGPQKDITGQTFYRLTALEPVTKNKNGEYVWSCSCACGNISRVPVSSLINGGIKSCGCIRTESAHTRKVRPKPMRDIAAQEQFNKYRRSANNRSIDFCLSKEEFLTFIDKDCFYCGETKGNRFKRQSNNPHITQEEMVAWCMGIDRVNNCKGYTMDNCVPCCKTCNIAKRGLPYAEFIDFAKRLYLNLVNKGLINENE